MSKLLAAVLACLVFATPAAPAHPHLNNAEPARDSGPLKSPEAIQLEFSEPIEATFSRVQLMDSGEVAVATTEATVDRHDPKRVTVNLLSLLRAGDYAVVWRVVGIDTHPNAGSYHFRVK